MSVIQVDKLLHGQENVVCADAGHTGVGRTSALSDQTSAWLRQGALPGLGEEYVADGYAVGSVESVDGSPTFTDERRRGASVMQEYPLRRARSG